MKKSKAEFLKSLSPEVQKIIEENPQFEEGLEDVIMAFEKLEKWVPESLGEFRTVFEDGIKNKLQGKKWRELM